MKDELKAGIVIRLLRIEIWEIQGLAMLKHLKIALHVSNSSNQKRREGAKRKLIKDFRQSTSRFQPQRSPTVSRIKFPGGQRF